MNSSVLLAVISLLGYGLDGSLAQTAVQKLGATRTIFWRCLFLTLILGLLTQLHPHALPKNQLLRGLLIAIAGYLPILAFYKALQLGKLGIVFPIATSSSCISILLATIFLGERFSPLAYIALALVCLGNIGLVLDAQAFRQKRFIINAGTLYALLACLGWGTVFFLYKYPTESLGSSMSAFLIEVGVLLAAGVHFLISRTPGKDKIQNHIPRMASMIIFAAIGVSFYTMALDRGPVSIVASIVRPTELWG